VVDGGLYGDSGVDFGGVAVVDVRVCWVVVRLGVMEALLM